MSTPTSAAGEEVLPGLLSLPSLLAGSLLQSRCSRATRGGEAGCLSLTRVSQASATISRVMVLSADDDNATARSLMGHMASATLRRPISCSSIAAASRPSLVLGDSSVLPATTMSRPGVWGNDVTGMRRLHPWSLRSAFSSLRPAFTQAPGAGRAEHH